MGKKIESETSGGTKTTAPVVEPGEGTQAGEAKDAKAKVKRTRVHRGQECEVIRVTKNRVTGAIYDLILYKRSVTNRRSGEVNAVFVGKKLRRPGTGVVTLAKEEEVEE
jgi:hypothetical protein